MSRRDRAIASVVVALLTLAYTGARVAHEPAWPTDFDQLWHAARALARGDDPYSVVGPGKAFRWDWPLYYPLPAVVLALPFSALPVAWARVTFSTFAGATLGWALGPRLRTHWPILLSAAYLIGSARTQWSPILLATVWLPWAGVAIAAKPNVGLAMLAALRGRPLAIAVASAGAVTVLSTVIRPDWIADWRAAIANAPHVVAPMFMPWGWPLALAALRWRRPDARLLLTLSLLPHTPSLYDLVPLFLLARSLRESLALAVLTHVLFWSFISFSGGPTFDSYADALGRVSNLLFYLPVLIAILLRPNAPEDSATSAPSPGPWRESIPSDRADAVLSLMLLSGAILLTWLPLATRR